MSKEHEVIMLLNKGRDILSRQAHRSGDTRNLQRDLDKIQQQWDRLRKDTVDRHTRLQTCMVSVSYHISYLQEFNMRVEKCLFFSRAV